MKYLIDSDVTVNHLNGKTETIELLTELLESGLAMSLMSYAEIFAVICAGTARHYPMLICS